MVEISNKIKKIDIIFGAAIATLIANVTIFILFKLTSKGLFKYDLSIGTKKGESNSNNSIRISNGFSKDIIYSS